MCSYACGCGGSPNMHTPAEARMPVLGTIWTGHAEGATQGRPQRPSSAMISKMCCRGTLQDRPQIGKAGQEAGCFISKPLTPHHLSCCLSRLRPLLQSSSLLPCPLRRQSSASTMSQAAALVQPIASIFALALALVVCAAYSRNAAQTLRLVSVVW
jgi:hypothetical protein